jgi:DNA-binding CsgD family transcriptional regulator
MRDITEIKRAESALRMAHDTLEKRVEKRTLQLQEANERLERVNTGLQVLIEHRQEEMERLRKTVVENANKLIIPYIEKMDKTRMSAQNRAYLEVIAVGLKELVSPFASALSSKEVVLSPTEIRVADLVRQGKASKEIAFLMNVSANAIAVHRYNIRRKLGLLKKKVNLRSYLESLSSLRVPPKQ